MPFSSANLANLMYIGCYFSFFITYISWFSFSELQVVHMDFLLPTFSPVRLVGLGAFDWPSVTQKVSWASGDVNQVPHGPAQSLLHHVSSHHISNNIGTTALGPLLL